MIHPNRHILKKCFALLLLILTLASIFVPATQAQAAFSGSNVVRIGWYNSEMFSEGMSDSKVKSGYCYDYLQKVADYTSWRYTYVYGDWSELMTMLEEGKIDMMGGVSITDERLETMLFPDSEMGNDNYYLYKKVDNKTIAAEDLSTIAGKKVGLITNNRMSYFVEQWENENNIQLDKVYFDSFEERDEAFDNGQVDLKVRTVDSEANTADIASVAYLGQEPYYMAVSKKRPDLLEKLDSAQKQLLTIDPYILQTLQSNNYGTSYMGRTLTDSEEEWISSHPTVKVGYLKNYLPYSAEGEDGSATGLVTDVSKAVFECFDLDKQPGFDYVAYSNYEDMALALKAGQVDIIFPVTNNLWQLEQDDINASSEVISDAGTLFYRKNISQADVTSIAVNKNNSLQIEYSRALYPDTELVYFDNIDDCLKGVAHGKADGTIMDSMRIQYVTSQSKYDSLSYVQLSSGAGKCFGVATGNSGLMSLTNKALGILGSTYGLDCSYKYIDQFYSYSLMDFIRDHLLEVALLTALLVAGIVMTLTYSLRKKEAQLREKEELKRQAEAANEAKSMFLFNMSHDIRTPMNAVLGFITLMEKEVDNPEKIADYLGKMKVSGNYLMSLINNVLQVARIDSGKENLNIDFADLLDEHYSVILESDINKKNLTFEKDLEVEHRYVYADIHKVREIMINLLSNAIKYTPEGGTIGMTLHESESDKPGYATYIASVYDTGIGMTEEFQKHVFEVFTRERNSTEGKVMGTGLGMAIVKKLVDIMGGQVTVQSATNQGTTFTVTVELAIVTDPQAFLEKSSEQKATQTDLRGRRILLAEDNELNAEIAKAILEEAGLAVERACDGKKCTDLLNEHAAGYFDLVLMDIQMPKMNGYEATKVIRRFEDDKKASIPIIAMTANAFDDDKQAALAAGMNGHLAKPIDVARLLETLRKYLT